MKISRLFFVSILVFLNTALEAQQLFGLTGLNPSSISGALKHEGIVKKAVRWTDKNGDNVMLLTETGIETNKKFKHENDGVDAELFAYHYIIRKDSTRLIWKINDFVSDCQVDIEMSFSLDAFSITDLNGDSIAEIWLLYRKVCHGDISPAEMKIIMYQDTQKYALRGYEKVFGGTDLNGINRYLGGDYKVDDAFAKGASVFLVFARNLWEKNMLKKHVGG